MDLTLYLIIEKVYGIQKKKELTQSFKIVKKDPLILDKVIIDEKYNTTENIDPYAHRFAQFEMN
jgi:hypothetical protein